MSRLLLLLGDSNVGRWVPHLGTPYLPIFNYLPVHNSGELASALSQVKPSYQMVVFAGFTNILVSAATGAPNDRFVRLEKLQTAIRETLTTIGNTIAAVPDPTYYLALPTVRTQPQWFLPMHADITQLIFGSIKKLNLPITPIKALPLSGQDLDSDGIHLNALAGLKYVQHLIDQPRALLELAGTEGSSDSFVYLSEAMVGMSTALNVHEVQIRMLTDQVLLTRCQQAEETCGRINSENLNRLIIVGGPFLPLSEQLQAKLKSQVAFYIRCMGPHLPTDIIHVRQFRGRNGGIYDVEMGSVGSSNRIRSAFGSFYRRGSEGPPEALSKLSITNSLTYASRVRVRIMKRIAREHQTANSDLIVYVTNYLPRPTLKLKEKKGPMHTYTYCEAVQKFSHHLSHDFLVDTTRFANVHLPKEDLRGTFLVLNPDFLKGVDVPLPSPTAGPSPLSATPNLSTPGTSKSVDVSSNWTTVVRGRGRKSGSVRQSSNENRSVALSVSKKGLKAKGKTIPRKPWARKGWKSPLALSPPEQEAEIAPSPMIIEPIDFSQEVVNES